MDFSIRNDCFPYEPKSSPASQEEIQKKLFNAVQKDDAVLIDVWIKRGAKHNLKDANGNTALHAAVWLGHLSSVEALLKVGANPLTKNAGDESALDIAQQLNSWAIIEALDQALRIDVQPILDESDLHRAELALVNDIMTVAQDEDFITANLLEIKAALRTRKRNPNFESLLKKIKQPWELRELDLEDTYCEIKAQISKLEQTGKAKNLALCGPLKGIQTVYQTFRDNHLQGPPKQQIAEIVRRACIRGVQIGCRYLNLEGAQRILSSNKLNESGKHIVHSFANIHWKQEPEAPGVEKAVLELIKLITGYGSPPNILLKATDGKKNIAVIASRTMPGQCLKSIMENHPDWLDKLDPTNYSLMVILGMLADFYDAKPDNFMAHVTKDASGQVQKLELVGIDNDDAFSDVFVRSDNRGDCLLDFINVLFVFPQMDQPIDPLFRSRFLKLIPEQVIVEWLKSMIWQNKMDQELRAKKVFSAAEFKQLQLPFSLKPPSEFDEGLIESLYRKFSDLQKAMQQNTEVTHRDLFRLVHPLVSEVYERRESEYLATIAESERSLLHLYQSKIHSHKNIKDLIIADTERKPFPGPLSAPVFERYRHKENNGCKFARRTLTPEKALERFLESMQWNHLSRGIQLKLLNSIASVQNLRALTFRDVIDLDDHFVSRILTEFQQLEALTLIRCPLVTAGGLSCLIKGRPHFRLTLGSCAGIAMKDYDILAQHGHLSILFPSGVSCEVKLGNVELLHQALLSGLEEIVYFALRFGISAKAKNEQHANSLHIAATLDLENKSQLKQWMTLLFMCGADLHETDVFGDTVLEKLEKRAQQDEVYRSILDHVIGLQKNHLHVLFEAHRNQEPWIRNVPNWNQRG